MHIVLGLIVCSLFWLHDVHNTTFSYLLVHIQHKNNIFFYDMLAHGGNSRYLKVFDRPIWWIVQFGVVCIKLFVEHESIIEKFQKYL